MRKIYPLITAACLFVSLGLIVAMSRTKTPLSRAYTLHYHASEIDSAGNVVTYYDETRYVSTSGNWRDVKTFPNGEQKPDLVGDYRRQSVLAVKRNGLVQVSEYHGRPNMTRESITALDIYKGTAYLLGYETLIVSNNGMTRYLAPDLDFAELKVEITRPNNSRFVLEPVSIEMGEPSAHDLSYPENLPVVTR
ncbi:MAG TPA: hypothetical protein VK619_09540 [Pyrinomonadaceae bacterium]|nr:hypothetical protein [Pyrinomonadaceae bacterium]